MSLGQQTILFHDSNFLLIAPGEGVTPPNIAYDEHAEELSFLQIYLGESRNNNPANKPSVYTMASSECRRKDRRGVQMRTDVMPTDSYLQRMRMINEGRLDIVREVIYVACATIGKAAVAIWRLPHTPPPRFPSVLTPAIEMTVTRGVLQLGIDLLRERRRSDPVESNVVLSPYATASALEEILIGFQELTAAQISAALYIPPQQRIRFA
ncbi:hypothetical protein MRX96_007650 [Rhipicephalus microplus]